MRPELLRLEGQYGCEMSAGAGAGAGAAVGAGAGAANPRSKKNGQGRRSRVKYKPQTHIRPGHVLPMRESRLPLPGLGSKSTFVRRLHEDLALSAARDGDITPEVEHVLGLSWERCTDHLVAVQAAAGIEPSAQATIDQEALSRYHQGLTRLDRLARMTFAWRSLRQWKVGRIRGRGVGACATHLRRVVCSSRRCSRSRRVPTS